MRLRAVNSFVESRPSRRAVIVGAVAMLVALIAGLAANTAGTNANNDVLRISLAQQRLSVAQCLLTLHSRLVSNESIPNVLDDWELKRAGLVQGLEQLSQPDAVTSTDAETLVKVMSTVQRSVDGTRAGYISLATRALSAVAGGLDVTTSERPWMGVDVATRSIYLMSLGYDIVSADLDSTTSGHDVLTGEAASAIDLLGLGTASNSDMFASVRAVAPEDQDARQPLNQAFDSPELVALKSLINTSVRSVLNEHHSANVTIAEHQRIFTQASDKIVSPVTRFAEDTKRDHRQDASVLLTIRTTIGALFVLACLVGVAFIVLSRRRDVARADQLQQRVLRDNLTGIGNRAFVEATIPEMIETHGEVVVMQLDLDHFKPVNDTYGHAVGDKLLVVVAQRLTSIVDANQGVCARLGGDEFVAIFPPLTHDTIDMITEEMVAAIREFEIDQIQISIGTSIGVSMGAMNAAQLLHNADLALYQAKRSGRGLASTFRAEAAQFVSFVRNALANGQVLACYQPQISLFNGRCGGVEVLARLADRSGSLIPAKDWLGVAEWLGVTDELFEHVVSAVRRDLEAGARPVGRLWFNIAPNDIIRTGGADWVLYHLGRLGLPATMLGIELTETEAIKNPDRLARSIQSFRKVGLGVALDDFGARNTPLGHLIDLPVTRVKLDSSLVAGLTFEMTPSAWVIKAMADLASRIPVELVAEGIETPDQIRALARLGVPAGQGYLLGMPGPFDRVPAGVDLASLVSSFGDPQPQVRTRAVSTLPARQAST